MRAEPSKLAFKNSILILLVVILTVFPLVFHSGAEFGGADGEAEKLITEINPAYQPWFQSLWEPPSGEVESLLFALQAALGSGFLGYYLGYVRGKKKQQEQDSHVQH